MEVSNAVARFSGEHAKGCDGMMDGLVAAEAAAQLAVEGLADAASVALREVRTKRRSSWTGRAFTVIYCSLY